MIKRASEDTLDTYLMYGKHLYTENPVHLGGEISLDKYGLITKGNGGTSNNYQALKGIGLNLEKKLTIIMVEWPIKKDASNIVYFLEKMPNQNTVIFNGKYTGFIYKNVNIEVPDDEEPIDMQIGEVLLSADFNEDNGIPIRMDLEN